MKKMSFLFLLLMISAGLLSQNRFTGKVMSAYTFDALPNPMISVNDKTITGNSNGVFYLEPSDSGIVQMMVVVQGCYPVYIKKLNLKKFERISLCLVEEYKKEQYKMGMLIPADIPPDSAMIPDQSKGVQVPEVLSFIELYDKKGNTEKYFLPLIENNSRAQSSRYELTIPE